MKIIKELEQTFPDASIESDDCVNDASLLLPKTRSKKRKSFGADGISLPTDSSDHLPGKRPRDDKGNQVLGRCIVCCTHCLTGAPHAASRGHRVDTGCWHCAALVAKSARLRKEG